ncbi:hypothetical protein ACFL50_04875 [Candidatus Latescibacterota bacterium]
MVDYDNVIDKLGLNRDLVFQFFGIFSRLEYSLKRCLKFRKKDIAEANWDVYANSLQGKFATVQDSEFKNAVAFLVDAPPRKQVVSDRNLDWKDTNCGEGERDENYVLRLVKYVRNNLFHGGKYPDPSGPVEDVGRNSELIKASIVILLYCLQLSPEVQHYFEETP